MSLPKNPETIVIKNEYYPNGLREIDIWNYYQKVKTLLLKETIGKNIMVFFATDINKFIVIRKNKSDGFVRLNMTDWDSVVSGRTISFHNIMNMYSNYGVIDIDTDDFKTSKIITEDIYDLFYKQKYTHDVKIIFTGKDSFHIRVYFNNDYKIEYIKQKLMDTLKDLNTKIKYTIKSKRDSNTINIDLQRNIYNAGFIALNSLSIIGLKCMEIDLKRLRWFKKEDAKIL